MLFSQRYGYKPVKSVIQVDEIDQDLRNGLWNALDIFYWSQIKVVYLCNDKVAQSLLKQLWRDYFKLAVDTLPDDWSKAYKQIREYFFSCKWLEVYDFIEFIASNPYYTNYKNENFMEYCNSILKRELSGYRFIGDVIAPITSEQEIAEIEEALTSKDTLHPITIHLQSALNLLSDRKSPDYRNSIKESISAIETICKLITKNKKASLSQAIKVITNKIELHSDLQEAFYKLYGYTSDADGIRHSLMDKPDLDFEDAKLMLVTCSAFINYLKVKSSKAGIKL